MSGVRSLLALLILASCRGSADDAHPYSGTLELPDVEVGSLVGGRVVRVGKEEGDAAAAGDLLVQLDDQEWRDARDEAQALAEVARRELALLEAGPRAEEIAEAQAEAKRLELFFEITGQGARTEEIEAARENLRAAVSRADEAMREAERMKRLFDQGVEREERLETAEATRAQTAAAAAAAQQHLSLLEHGQRPEEIEAARQAWLAQVERVKALQAGARPEELAAKHAALEAAEARIRVAESKLRELSVTAPAACHVQTLDLEPGDIVAPGRPVAVLLLHEPPEVTVYVPEADLARVNVGQRAVVVPDGHPPLGGEVVWISRRAEFTPRNVQTRDERAAQVFAVKVEIAGDTSRLKDGMWADVTLE